ncbi:MAG: SH3 domain-containing protein [Anaerolineales bacterium]|nr:SH3 domain-containing protein [Anaerolineales bacterium]
MKQQNKTNRVWGWSFSLATLLLVSLFVTTNTATVRAADSEWQAKYWNNKTLSGDPVLVRQEPNLNHDWGSGAPTGVNVDNFSARWKRTINTSAGTYRFTVTMDDGMRVWVDNALILDSWYDSQVHSLTATTTLSAGDHQVKVEYYDAGGGAIAKLVIEPISVDIARWRGEYFNNTTLSGTPVLVRDDERIDFNWGVSSPAWNVVTADNFSVRWTRSITLDQGRYRFTTTTDDGVRLWVNGRLLIDKWFDQAETSYTAEIDLPGGATDIRMEYYEGAGGAVARLDRTKVAGPTGDDTWRGEYFNNKTLTGSPALVRNDANIAFNWGNGSPDASVNVDNFSVRWTRTLYLSPGLYRFTANTDDGVRLWVNGQQIINAWNDHAPQDFIGEITLPGGNVELKMEYYEHVGGARANLSRTLVSVLPSPSPTPIPPASPATATVASLRLNFRQGPGPTYGITQVLSQGNVVSLLARNQAATWAQVLAPNGAQGWVYAPLLFTTDPIANLPPATGISPDPVSSGPIATVSNAVYALNVRSGPGVTFEPITAIVRGQQVNLIGRNAAVTWIKVQLADGRQGWSSATYLVSSTGFATLPVTN